MFLWNILLYMIVFSQHSTIYLVLGKSQRSDTSSRGWSNKGRVLGTWEYFHDATLLLLKRIPGYKITWWMNSGVIVQTVYVILKERSVFKQCHSYLTRLAVDCVFCDFGGYCRLWMFFYVYVLFIQRFMLVYVNSVCLS